jgi:DnaD/phage-associated family protein
MNHADLTADMSRLAAAELVELQVDEDGNERWFIPKFEKRQARSNNAKRQARWRERQKEKRKEAKEKRIIDIDKDKDKDTSNVTSNVTSNGDGYGRAVSSYENNIAPITPIVAESIGDAVDEFGAEDVIEAIKIAVEADVRKWAYVNGILSRWRKDGKNGGKFEKVGEADQLEGAW